MRPLRNLLQWLKFRHRRNSRPGSVRAFVCAGLAGNGESPTGEKCRLNPGIVGSLVFYRTCATGAVAPKRPPKAGGWKACPPRPASILRTAQHTVCFRMYEWGATLTFAPASRSAQDEVERLAVSRRVQNFIYNKYSVRPSPCRPRTQDGPEVLREPVVSQPDTI
jgi:hypothetical protein